MATGFRTSTGQIIGGQLGSALAGANPSQGVSYSPNIFGAPIVSYSSGGGGSSSSSAATESARIAAAAKANALAAEKAALAEKEAEAKAIAEAQIAAAKSQAEKNKLARAYIEQRNSQSEFKKILNTRSNLINSGATSNSFISTENSTGNKLDVTRWRDRYGNSVVRRINLASGKTTWEAWKKPAGGGNVRQVGEVSISAGTRNAILRENYDRKKYNEFQNQLKSVEKYLPTGILFVRDSMGDIVSLDDTNQGVNYDLNNLGSIIPENKLITAGLVTAPVLPKENVSAMIKRVTSAFSVKKWKAYREKQRQDYYDLFGLTGKDRNFYTLAARARNASPSQSVKIQNLAVKNLKQDLLNPDTAIRAEAAMVVTTIFGGVVIGAIVGSVYKTPIKLETEQGLNLQNANWKQVAKIAGLEFGKEALAGYLFSKIFGVGGRVVSRVPLTRMTTRVMGQKLGIFSSKAIKVALIKGLEVAYAGYLASVGTKGVRAAIATSKGDYKTATGEAAGVLGAYVGIEGERLSQKVLAKIALLFPGNVKLVSGKYVLRTEPKEIFEVKGKKVYLKERVLKPSIKRPISSVSNWLKGRKPGQFKKFTKDPGLFLVESTVASGKMPFEKQLDIYSNKEVTAVTAMADDITGLIKRKKIIRKPIAGEENFPPTIKKILAKLDSGKKLTINEIVKTSVFLKKNVAPNITILERSLYADPASGLRLSRLGIEKEKPATLRDILRNNFSLKGNKPAVHVFENAKIAKSPTRIKNIAEKIKVKGINGVSEKELAEIIKWQLVHSTKFKAGGSPIYASGQELEITAYGVYVRRIKKLGFKYIKGKKVNFYSTELWTPPKNIKLKIKAAQDGKLKPTLLKKLEALLSKKLGQKIKIETPKIRTNSNIRRRINLPILRIKGSLIFVLPRSNRSVKLSRTIRGISRLKTTRSNRITRKVSRTSKKSRTTKRPISKRGVTKRPTSRRPIKRKTPKRTTTKRTPTRRPVVRRQLRRTTTKRTIRLGKFKKKKLSKTQQTYYVVEKVRGKLKKLYPFPLTKKDARDYLAYNVDNNLSRTGFFIPSGKNKKVYSPPKKIKGYFNKNSRKLRPYKIRHGKSRKMINGYIEKNKFIQDTKTEKSQLRNSRRLGRRPVRRKLSPQQRRTMLKNLARARAMRSSTAIKKRPTTISRRPTTIRRRIQRKKRIISPSQRKILLQRLKRARAIRMQNLRRRR